jgi:hypothetical protein
MRDKSMQKRVALVVFLMIVFLAAQNSNAEEGSCYLQADESDVFLIVYDLDDDGNQGTQIWEGRINQGESAEITAPHGQIRYDYNDQPDVDQPLSGGSDRWCNNLETILVP